MAIYFTSSCPIFPNLKVNKGRYNDIRIIAFMIPLKFVTYLQMSISLLIAMFMAGYVYMGNVYDTPYLLAAGYCFGDQSTPDSCIMTSEDLEYTLLICVGEFLSVPLFAVSSEMLGRIRASNILSAILLVILICCCFCFGKVVLVIELFLTRSFSNAVLLLIYIYTPETYPTYMRSIAFGVVMLSFNMAGVAAVFSVYVVGDTISWAYMWWSFIIAGLILLVTTFFFNKETVGQRLEDNRDLNQDREQEEGLQSPRVQEPGETVSKHLEQITPLDGGQVNHLQIDQAAQVPTLDKDQVSQVVSQETDQAKQGYNLKREQGIPLKTDQAKQVPNIETDAGNPLTRDRTDGSHSQASTESTVFEEIIQSNSE